MLLPSSSYPIQGLWYFLRHPKLWWKCFVGLVVSLVVALALLGGFFGLLPTQAHALIRAGCPAGLAWVVGVVFVLLESALAFLIFAVVFVEFVVDGLVDYVWAERGLPHDDGRSCCRACGTSTSLAVLTMALQVLVLVLTLPLNLIPVVGTWAFCYINGFLYAWERQQRYDVEIRGFSTAQSWGYARGHIASYGSFGMVCYFLNLIPVANFLFVFTNAVGAALWSADQYHAARREEGVAGAGARAIAPDGVPPSHAGMVPPSVGMEGGGQADVLDVADGRLHQRTNYGTAHIS